MLHFFRLHGGGMANDEQWGIILKEALDECIKTSNSAVPGAKLRETLSRVAQKNGETYPPVGGGSFGNFLKKYPNIVAVRKRLGQDILIAPHDQPDLLIIPGATADKSQSGIRRDLFEAFTFVKNSSAPWYNTASDSVEWLPAGNPDPNDSTLKKIPAVTLSDAIDDRKKFIETLENSAWQTALHSSLTDVNSLSAFSKCIVKLGLLPDWHKFRLTILTQRISDWVKAAGIEWKDAWLTTSLRGEDTLQLDKEISNEPSRQWRQAMLMLTQSLNQEDLSRISVPLDIVLKTLVQRR